MQLRKLSFLAAPLAVVLLLDPALVSSQQSTAQKKVEAAKKEPASENKNWKVPRTAWGDPDFQGIWTVIGDYLTPFQRPVEMGTRALLTDEEYAKKLAEANQDNEAVGHIYFDTLNGKPSRRTSLIVDPPDGRMPPFTPEGKRRFDAMIASSKANTMVNPVNTLAFGVGERCITRTLVGAGAPRAYDNERQFFQTKKNIMLLYEEIHDARIIPIDGSPHIGPNYRDWLGDSRGHWEGDTLVVDATNFRDRMTFNGSPGVENDIPVSEHLHIVERFTRIEMNTIRYTTTVDDPETFTRPFTIENELRREPEQTQILEFACHEGNKAVEIGLRSARYEEEKGIKK